GHSQWFAAGAGDVAGRFGHGDHGAGVRIGMYVAAVAIHGYGQCAAAFGGAFAGFTVAGLFGVAGFFEQHEARIAGGVGAHIVGAHHGVVLLTYPTFAGDVGAGE